MTDATTYRQAENTNPYINNPIIYDGNYASLNKIFYLSNWENAVYKKSFDISLNFEARNRQHDFNLIRLIGRAITMTSWFGVTCMWYELMAQL